MDDFSEDSIDETSDEALDALQKTQFLTQREADHIRDLSKDPAANRKALHELLKEHWKRADKLEPARVALRTRHHLNQIRIAIGIPKVEF
jgi:hypothetical protein